jgi:lipopolysaccharide/colanic/teichoic acid biosynthesis glycosyltransferase
MNSPFESPPSIAGAIVAVALATVALLLANFTSTLPAHLSSVRLSAADAVFSALLAVCWLCIASWAQPDNSRTERFSAIVRVFQRSVPVSALFAAYIIEFHHNVLAPRATIVFLLCTIGCETIRILLASKKTCRRALVMGTGRVATTVWRDLRTGRLPEMCFAGFTCESSRDDACPDIAARYVGNLRELKSIFLQHAVDDLIVATPISEGTQQTEQAVQIAASLGVRVLTVKEALGVPNFGKPRHAMEYIELVPAPDLNAIKSAAKRSVDVIISAFVLLVGLPAAVAVFASKKLCGYQINFEVQKRIGLHRRSFRIHRTSFGNRPDRIQNWANQYLVMWNVLRGDMSMVGPRALSPEDLSRTEMLELAGRFAIRPGLTGASEFKPGDTSSELQPQHGLKYTERWSLGRDLVLLARAVRAFVLRNLAPEAETSVL